MLEEQNFSISEIFQAKQQELRVKRFNLKLFSAALKSGFFIL